MSRVMVDSGNGKPNVHCALCAGVPAIRHQAFSNCPPSRLIADLEMEHAQLQDKITERAAKYGLRLQDMENFAFSILTVNNGWSSLQQTKEQIEQTLNNLIISAQPHP